MAFCTAFKVSKISVVKRKEKKIFYTSIIGMYRIILFQSGRGKLKAMKKCLVTSPNELYGTNNSY